MGHREDLLAGAVRCLREKGYAHTTARDIVAASGTNLASIGYHYGSTKALLNAAVLAAMDDFGQQMAQAIGGLDAGATTLERFERFWTRVIDSFRTSSQVWLATFDIFAVAQRDPDVRAAVADGLEDGQDALGADALRRGPRRRAGPRDRLTAPGAGQRRPGAVADRPGAGSLARRARPGHAGDGGADRRGQLAQLCWAAEIRLSKTHGLFGPLPPCSALGRPSGNVNEARVQTQRVPDDEHTFTGSLSVTTVATGSIGPAAQFGLQASSS